MTPTLLALSTLVLHNREREGCAAGLNASDVKNSCGKSQWNAQKGFALDSFEECLHFHRAQFSVCITSALPLCVFSCQKSLVYDKL